MKRRALGSFVGVLALPGVLAGALVACGDSATTASSAAPTSSSAPGSGAAPGQEAAAGTLPAFALPNAGGGGAGAAGPPDAGAVTEVPGTPAVVPDEPALRRVWAVDARGHLLRILAADPTNVIDVALLTMPPGSEAERFVGIDFRPQTAVLYGITNVSRLYRIDLAAAKAVPVAAGPTGKPISGQAFGFDVDPHADMIRVDSDVDQNLQISPSTGDVSVTDAMLAFALGDPNYLQSPNVVGTAYANNIAEAVSTTLYAIDSTRNLLTKIAPATGDVTTIGELGVDITAMAGFDIWGGDAVTEAYAAMQVEGEDRTALYRLDLATGAATLVGAIAHPSPLVGMAVEP